MEKIWENCDIDPALLMSEIEKFFRKRCFKDIIKQQESNSYQIIATNSPCFQIYNCITITFEKKKNNIKVRFRSGIEGGYTSPPNMLTLMFAGGYFLKRFNKINVGLIRLEKEFWIYLNSIISSADFKNSKNRGY